MFGVHGGHDLLYVAIVKHQTFHAAQFPNANIIKQHYNTAIFQPNVIKGLSTKRWSSSRAAHLYISAQPVVEILQR